ncbi:SusC/RagA family TonB-linked outer membrane protein [Prevotella sp.]|uniref:SusC/RagA family TonB-linked outer membrane protein n=1 Tax=Prevotella sp. TaxID=59823 RepID=UPI0027E25EC3|nr:SusC/RagA family TonB-linked outer membrane protein [Prevotella sp.]
MELNKNLIVAMLATGISANTFAANDSTNPESVETRRDTLKLSEIVVVGYGKMRRKDITSSITTIQSSDLNQGVYTSPAQLLQGKVPGLTVSNSGDPNAAPSITLRGASTLRTGAAMEPYYIVDGVPGVDLSLVATDDIESIDILRDATATAIYGSKAANGVIIVTTKHGHAGTARVTYNGYMAVESVSKNLDLASAADLRTYAANNGFELTNDMGANVDWQKEVQRTGISHNHNLAVSGGNTRSGYNVSLNYLNHEGIIRSSEMERFGARALAHSKVLKDHLQLSLGVNASQTTKKGIEAQEQGISVTDAMVYYSPCQAVRNDDGTWTESTSTTQYYNPLSMINEDTRQTVYRRMQLTGKADLNLLKDLTWTAQYSYMYDQNVLSEYHSTKSQIVKNNGQATRSTYMNNKEVFETFANYNHSFPGYHRVGAMIGYSWEQTNQDDGFGLTVKDFYNDAVKYYNLSYANKIDGMDGVESGAESTLRMISFYGRLNYSYASRYNFQATLRRDGSSAFGKNNRWATFPSVSAAWRIGEEEFIRNLGIFSDLKLRVGYGVSGNSLGFDAYSARRTYGVSGWFQYTDENGVTTDKHTLAATNNANPDLKWERTGMFNIGVDFGFFDSRLTGTIEYYDKRTSDLIYYYPVSTNRYPYGTMTANVGDISNRGIELTINAIPVQNDDWQWTTTLNLSHNRNRVEKLSNAAFSVKYQDLGYPWIAGNTNVAVQRLMEGCPIGQFYTYEFAGHDENGISQFWVHDPATGKRTGEKTIKPEDTDRTKTGSAQPKLTLGWTNNLSYKNWTLNLFFQGMFGNKIFNALRAQYNSVTLIKQGKNVLREALTNQNYGDVNSQSPSDRYIENGSFMRLSSMTLSYNFGKLKGWVDNLSVYATCNNVFTLTSYKGADPEVSLGGLTPGIDWRKDYYPHTRTFMFGMKVSF